jgi:putative spermidine/putrescine transport system permease protein
MPESMKVRWEAWLWPPLVVSFLLLAVPQAVFLRMSLFRDLGLGRVGNDLELGNYAQFITDRFYLESLGLTVFLSAVVVVLAVALGFPVAYALARMRPGWGSLLLAVIVTASFVTVVIKVLGLIIIFSAEGPLNRTLLWLGLIGAPVQMLGNRTGVVIGLLHYTLAFVVLMLFGVIQTIPRSLEEAAQIHGASRWRVFQRVVIPLSLPGLIAGALIVFNMSMGAFTSAALLGGGKVLTLPVLVQRTIVLETKYGMGAALSAVLLIVVFLVNLISVGVIGRFMVARRAAA